MSEREKRRKGDEHLIFLYQHYREVARALLSGELTADEFAMTEAKLNYDKDRKLERDALTGAFSRQHMLSEIEAEVQEAIRSGLPLGVAYFDLDYFGKVNKTYGHAVGDQVLLGFTNVMNLIVNGFGSWGRLGGEEFVAVWPNCSAENLDLRVKLIGILVRTGVGQSAALKEDQTVTIGATFWDRGESWTEFLDRSDKLMLKAKKQGRDRAIVYVDGEEKTINYEL
jgi:diguanylate cyclase (GGDEF)-like protein